MKLRGLVLFGLMVATVGCGGDGTTLAPVSGVVTVDGKPYPNAYVMFQPVASGDNPNPGRGSMAITDGEGKFTLRYDGGAQGAVVGTHVVRISTVQEADNKAQFDQYKDTGTPDGEPEVKGEKGIRPEIIPPSWNTDSDKTFTVPPGGTKEANFDIVTGRKGKK